MALASSEGWLFLLRWIHFLAGITWIGLLYYFNFVQTPFFAETEAPVRSGAIQKLVPRAPLVVPLGRDVHLSVRLARSSSTGRDRAGSSPARTAGRSCSAACSAA